MNSTTSKKNSDLSEKKKLLLKQLLKKEAQRDTTPEARPIVLPRADRQSYPLALNQRQSWKSAQLVPGIALVTALRLNGPVDLCMLEKSMRDLTQRHEILRAIFPDQDGTPTQRVLPTVAVHLSQLDLSTQLPEEAEQALESLLAPHQQAAFDIFRGPLFRTSLIRLSEVEHFFVLAIHPLLADNTTLALLAHELLLLYKGATTGHEVSLPECSLTYADYAHWQREYMLENGRTQGDAPTRFTMQDTPLKELQHYWQQQLTGATLTLNLPLDHPRTAQTTGKQRTSTKILDATLMRQVQAFCARENSVPETCYFAVLALLLNRYTSQTDMVIGRSSTTRAPELEHVAGPFTTIQPVRVQLHAKSTAQAFLQQIHKTLLMAERSQGLPLESIVETTYPQHDLTREPFFQTSFAFQQLPSGADLSAYLVPPRPTQPLQDLSFSFQQSAEQLAFSVFYDGNLFDAASIERLHNHFTQLLTAFVEQPSQALETFSCLTASERTQILYHWNAAALDKPPATSLCLHHLFEDQIARAPENVALSDGQRSLTYAELNARANQLAHLLRRRGIGPEHLVGLCLSRSFDLLIGQLAILKAGAAYVPLDPSYPRDRLDFTIQDAGLNVILTEQDLLTRMPFSSEQALCLDTPGLYSQESSANLALAMHNDQLAYVIYTSGSTGRPKGVCIRHRNAVVFIRWARQEFSDEELAGVLFGTSICFDLSIFEVFAPLSWGGKVILATTVLDLPHLATRERITLLNTVPSAAMALLNAGDLPSSLLTINLAGEALARDLVQALYQRTIVRRVCNLYGPTEDTTYSTGATMGVDDSGAVTIGRPLINTQVYIVDAQMQPVPIGVAGELYLGGDGQARGYLKRPDLTAERFMPDPFSRTPGSRLYRTGDLARYRADGSIDYLGRLDHQVKIRGFRIELGEIEAHLRQHPAVADVVVVALDTAPGEKQLVAYIVASQDCDSSQLRSYLQTCVPAYMVPAFFVLLDHLPQTPNGKVDRKKLPAPTSTGLTALGSELPQEERAQWLAHLWQEILHLPTVGLHDNFFLCGGDSLLARRLLAHIQRDFHQVLTLNDIFASPTIAQLAEKLQMPDIQHDLKPINAQNLAPDTAFPLSFAQQRIWFVDQLESGVPMHNVPLALALSGPLQRLALYQAIYEIIRRHEPLRTTIRVIKGTPFQCISPLVTPAITFMDLTLADPQKDLSVLTIAEDPAVLHALQEEVRHPFDLEAGPLLRIRLLRLCDDQHILLLNMHHIITDGWSLGILIAELGALYNAFSMGRTSPLPQLPIKYTDFVAWQRTHQATHYAEHRDYWKTCFSPLPANLALPTDYPRPVVQTFAGNSLSFQIPYSLTQPLLALSQQENATLFMTLLTGFYILLARYCGQEDLVVGTSVANRPHPDLEPLIGFFVNTLALRVDLSGQPTGRELLHRVRETALNAYHHQELPFERVVEAVQPPRDPARSPLFQVLFLLQNLLSTELNLQDVQTHEIEIAPPTALFDLSFILVENTVGLRLTIEYNTHLFTATTIERMQAHYQFLLAALCQQPDLPIYELAPRSEELQDSVLRQNIYQQIVQREVSVPAQPRQINSVAQSFSPKTTEEHLAHIWKKVLGLSVVGRDDSFFEIGGHSLLAMQVLAAIREELHVAISIRQFFSVPTIASLADLIETENGGADQESDRNALPSLVPVERTGDLPLSFAQQRLWFLDQLEGSSATYNIPVVLRLTGELNIPALRSSVREIVRRHEALRTTFPKGQHTPIQCVQLLPLAPVELIDFSLQEMEDPQSAILQAVQTEIQHPFDLAEGPLLRTCVLRLGHVEHIIIFVMHHIVSDGWSMAILAQEFNALYNAFSAGQPSPLPELTIQYGDFVVWQRSYLQGPRLAAHLDYWRKQLGGAAILKLPTDHPRIVTSSAPGARCSTQWSQSFARQLQAFSQQEDVTLFMTLLAAFQMLLAFSSGQDDITVGSPVANRAHPALEPLVGFFVNTLALRSSLAGDPTIREVVQRVRDVTLGAYDHQDVPFEQVVEVVQPERQPGIPPLFQVFFVLQNNTSTALTLTNLQAQSLEMHTATAKFDIAVSLETNSNGLDLSMEYNTRLFERSTIQQMQECYRLLLEKCVADPETRLTDLSGILARKHEEKKGQVTTNVNTTK